ncbi:outer membrane protein assembly factor BamB family protein [Nocardiopsis listeri]|uniref:outer membrane protein assembly factor BamB family protein n=1 Tax=Nocardiopsis listeri TaxID=53440 RepID=UPI000830DD88|nr:PQQ-binding-like beta-propeller repeat protein [Nocardiopsis listeri]
MTIAILSRYVWLTLRALAVLTFTIVLWQRTPLPTPPPPALSPPALLPVLLPPLLAFVLYFLRAPGDPPGRPRYLNPFWVFLADLLAALVLFISFTFLFSGLPWQLLTALAAALLGAFALRWRATPDPVPYPLPHADPRRHPTVVVPAVLLTLAMLAGLAATVTWRPLREQIACGGLTTSPGAPRWWTTETAEVALPEEFPEPSWQRVLGEDTLSAERTAGASDRSLILADDDGVVALATEDGTPSWHLDTTHLDATVLHGNDDSFSPDGVAHVGSTVLIEYDYPRTGTREQPGPLVMAFDDLTGEQVWCGSGIRGVVTGIGSSEHFVAWSGEEPTLFDSTDGSVVATLRGGPSEPVDFEDDEEFHALVDDGRVLLWERDRLSAFDLETGDALFTVEDVVPDRRGAGSRNIKAVIASQDVTVVEFGRGRLGGENDAANYLAAYDLDGEPLWDSTGEGVTEVGGPLVGGELMYGQASTRVVFDEHVLARSAHGERRPVHAVNLREGTITWSSADEPYGDCSSSDGTVLDETLYRANTVITSEGCSPLENTPLEKVFGVQDAMVAWSEHRDRRVLSFFH